MRIKANELLQNGVCNISLTYGTQRTGYAVPVPGRKLTFPAEELNDSEVSYFVTENADLLGNPEYMVNGVIEDGEVSLRVTKKFTNKLNAIAEAKDKKVYEVIDLKNEMKIYV